MQVPKAWRERLKGLHISTGRSKLHSSVTATDGTRKFLLQLHDGLIVETVGIPADDADRPRLTVCVSSQVSQAQPLCSAAACCAHGSVIPAASKVTSTTAWLHPMASNLLHCALSIHSQALQLQAQPCCVVHCQCHNKHCKFKRQVAALRTVAATTKAANTSTPFWCIGHCQFSNKHCKYKHKLAVLSTVSPTMSTANSSTMPAAGTHVPSLFLSLQRRCTRKRLYTQAQSRAGSRVSVRCVGVFFS